MKKRARLSDLSGKEAFFGGPPAVADENTGKQVSTEKRKPVSVQAGKQAKPHTRIRVKKATSKEVGKHTRKAVSTHTSIPVKKKAPQKLIKFTFYFNESQLNDLDEVRLKLRKEHGIKIDKSSIVRLAVDRLVEDFQKNRKASALVSMHSALS